MRTFPVVRSKPKVSLCMIVKNEEKFLPQCLESVRELVDEMIIVDTGSTDKTVAIAKSHGAKVHFFKWVNDFAAARNESLRHATGDWIFSMDADERINPGPNGDCLRDLASVSGIDAYLVPIKSHKQNEREHGFHYAVRFFKNHPDVCYEGEVHESVNPFLEKKGATIVPAPFLIEHFGYAIDSTQMEQKLQRNISLLRKTLERTPRNAFAQYYLGMSLLVMQREEEGLDAFQKALRGEGLTKNIEALTLNAICFIHLARKDYEKVIETARKSLYAIPNQNTAKLLMGAAYYHLEQYSLALPYLFTAYQFLRTPAQTRRTGITKEDLLHDEVDVLRAIAICYAKTGEYAKAVAFFHRYLSCRSGDAELFRSLGICSINCQDYPSAVRYLKEAKKLGTDGSFIEFPLAWACFHSGELEESRKYFSLKESQDFSDQERSLLELLINYYFERNLIQAAIDFLDPLSRRFPDEPIILDALGIAYIKDGNSMAAIELYKRLSTIHPENRDISRRLAALMVRAGDIPGARKILSDLE